MGALIELPLPREMAAIVLLAATLFAPVSTMAQEHTPTDVQGWDRQPQAPVLADPPRGFVTEQVGHTRWTFPRRATGVVRDLQEAVAPAWERIAGDLGTQTDRRVTIRVGRNPSEMNALAPEGRAPPGYAVGVAYPDLGLILLTLTAPDTWERPDLDRVLTHELSHIALYRAVEGHRVPRWFTEGVAIHQAGENNLARMRALWLASIGDDVAPLSHLSARFPSRPHQVNAAYAQSADMVGFLRGERGDRERFVALIRHVRAGLGFDASVREAYGVPLGYLERQWRAELDRRYSRVPLLLSGAGLWMFVTLLLLFAYVRRRRAHRAALERLGREEAQELAAIEQTEQAVDHWLSEPSEEPPRPPPPVLRERRDSTVPTVEVDGENHTLH